MICADVNRLTYAEQIADGSCQNNFVCGRGKGDLVVRVVRHRRGALHNSLHIGGRKLNGHQEPFIVVNNGRLNDGEVGERSTVAIGAGLIPVAFVGAEVVLQAGERDSMTVFQGQCVAREIGVRPDFVFCIETNRVRFPSSMRAARNAKSAVRFVVIPVRGRHINTDVIALTAILGIVRITVIGLRGKHGLAVNDCPGADALPPIKRRAAIEIRCSSNLIGAGSGSLASSVPQTGQGRAGSTDARDAVLRIAGITNRPKLTVFVSTDRENHGVVLQHGIVLAFEISKVIAQRNGNDMRGVPSPGRVFGREAEKIALIHAVVTNGIGRGCAEICGLRRHLISVRQSGELH